MKRWLAGMLAGFFLFPPCASAQSTPAQSASVVQVTLNNGMRVVLLPNVLAPVATTVLTYGVGSTDDTMPGIAHATEHMMFRGSTAESAQQFGNLATRAGADYNAQTTDTYTDYYFKLPSAYVGVALRLEADRMNGALMHESDWLSERGAIEQEVRAHESAPGSTIMPKVLKAFFGDSPWARDGVGTVESFQKMHASQIKTFYDAWYHPNNAVLVVAGDIDPQKTLAQIHSDFDGIAPAKLPDHPAATLAPIQAQTLRDSIAEVPVPVAGFNYRFPSLTSPDFAAGQVLSTLLNSGRGQFADLTATGRILGGYAVSGAFRDFGQMAIVGVGLPGHTPDDVQSQLQTVIDAFRKDGVTAGDVEIAKTRMLAERDYRESSISGLASTWAQWLALDQPSPDKVYTDIANVTVDDVNRVAREYLDPAKQLTILLQPKPSAAAPHPDAGSAAENVQIHVERDEPLPQWAAPYFNAPLAAPSSVSGVVTTRLPNGIELSVRTETLAPTVVVEGAIRSDAQLYEPRGKDGVDDITSSLIDYGTTTYDRKAYQSLLESLAATADLGSDFSLRVQAKNFDRAMQLLADGMLHPAFPAQGFTVVKNDLERTLAATAELPQTQAAIARNNALYPPGDPRRRRSTAATVAAVTLDDVKRWYRFQFRPDITVVSIVGDVTPDEARAALQKYFGGWHAAGKPPNFEYPKIRPRAGKSVTIASVNNRQSDVTLSQVLNVRPGDRDYVPLLLANTVLSGEGTGSTLFRDLRTARGYVYNVDSSMDIGYTNSTFSIDFSSDSKNVGKAQAAAVSDIKQMQRDLLPESQLQRAKALLVADRVLPLDSYAGIASDLLDSEQMGLSHKEEQRFWSLLLDTTPAQIRAAMRRWIKPDRFVRVIVAPSD